MSTQQGDKKLNEVKAILRVNGQEKHYVSIDIIQQFYAHHTFTVCLNYAALEKEWMQSPEQTMGLMGKLLTIELMHAEDESRAYVFTGVITDIGMKSTHGGFGGLIELKGASPSILLDRGKHMNSFTNAGFSSIIKEIKEGIPASDLDFVCATENNKIFDFVCQYKESDFEFINRMAILHHEWFFYTGTQLFFGKPDEREAVEVVYEKHLDSINLHTRILPPTFKHYAYAADKDERYESPTPQKPEGAAGFTQVALDRSTDSYGKETLQYEGALTADKSDLETLMKAKKAQAVASMVVMSGKSRTIHTRIGCRIDVKLPNSMKVPKDLGLYRVTYVHHSIDQAGRYLSSFEAVPAALNVIPTPDVVVPFAEPQLATVRENADDLNQGRVIVHFPWQSENKQTNLIRVMTPDAGSSEAVAKNRGFVFIPEKGDQVMVGFEQGNPNRPFVMGSMFHGKNGKGGDEKNVIRSISTPMGSTITFDDKEHTIAVQTSAGNFIHINEKKGNIDVTAAETITFAAKNIKVQAEENIELSAKQNIIHTADADITITAKGNLSESSDGDTSIQAKGKADINATADVTLAGQNAVLNGKTKTEISGQQTTVNGQMVTVQGASHKLDIL